MDGYFDEYEAYAEDSIISVLPDGIRLSEGRKILFDECFQNYNRYFPKISEARCVGEKDTDDGSFMFYCTPRPVMIKFFDRLLSKSVRQRMNELENQIKKYGYSFTESEIGG